MIKLYALFASLFCVSLAFSQLDTLHYLPPMHSRDAAQVADHYIYLSTLEGTTFTVTITTPSGNPITSIPISKISPGKYTIGLDDPTVVMVPRDSLLTVLKQSGLKMTAPFPFFANFRARSSSQAELITCKGTTALGKTFRAGVVPLQVNSAASTSRSFFTSFIAVENNTDVSISGYDQGVTFSGPGTSTYTLSTLNVVLNKGQSYILSGYSDGAANDTGFVGALIQASKPIVVNNGNWLGSIGTVAGNQDIMADQTVPIEWIGKEYVVIQGGGTPLMERPLVIAHYNNTDIYAGGTFLATINAGEHYLIDNSYYTGTVHKNMYISTSMPVYLYQPIGGSAVETTPGMNFIPPLSCFFPREVVIPDVDTIGVTAYSGAILVLTTDTATLRVNGIVQTGSEAITGLLGWESYKISGFNGDVDVTSTGPAAVGLFGYSGAAGFAGYFSGFGAKASELSTMYCPGNPYITLTALDGFSYVWKNQNGTILGTQQTVIINEPSLGDVYTVYMTNGPGCVVEMHLTLTYTPPPDLPQYIIKQNVMTPNGDGINDKFVTRYDYSPEFHQVDMSYVKEFNIHIYDRWGNIAFTSTDPTNEWDGKLSNGKPADDGTYFWHLTYKSTCVIDPDNTIFENKGFVMLIR